MAITGTQPTQKPKHSRLFYPIASAALLVLTLIGFRFFYFHFQAYPGRPLPEPAVAIYVIHGVLMTAWILLAVVQPFLVATGRKRIHMMLGKFAMVLAVGIIVAGYLIAIGSTKGTPPELVRFGLAPKAFLTVPLSGVLTFGLFLTVGVLNRRRPEIHRPMMFMASLAVVAAALGRIAPLNDWYAGTWLEVCFSAFVSMLLVGVVLLAVKCAIEKRFDRWFAGGLAVLAFICMATSLTAKTGAWDQIAALLLR
jgi:hypothetical protein